MRDQAAEAAVAAVANKVTFAGGGTAVLGGLVASDIVAFGGLFVALCGLAINFYYRRRSDRRDAEEHTARMDALRKP